MNVSQIITVGAILFIVNKIFFFFFFFKEAKGMLSIYLGKIVHAEREKKTYARN